MSLALAGRFLEYESLFSSSPLTSPFPFYFLSALAIYTVWGGGVLTHIRDDYCLWDRSRSSSFHCNKMEISRYGGRERLRERERDSNGQFNPLFTQCTNDA
jgi:hypothetical protein